MKVLSPEGLLLVWALGWAFSGVVVLPVWLKLTLRTGEERSETAQVRTMWGSRGGRVALLIILFMMWPLIIVSFVIYMVAELGDLFVD